MLNKTVEVCTWKRDVSAPGEKKKTKEFRLDPNDIGFICAGVSNVGTCERNV